ncbi:type II secretion system F family protein [Paenibacillus sp. SYP-B4298]|uniref:type II secretion system F family protein n=1 Tax=Paenibacillus sp. SYP-B4298 TaxID=2996034 RepID=UPI0022DDA3E2|nr:type II secretion system F family protein [Paenibacillus sp. SYP-B4298]
MKLSFNVSNGKSVAHKNDSGRLPIYTELELTVSQRIAAICAGSALCFAAGYIFYHSIWIAALIGAAGLRMPRLYRHYLLQRRRNQLKQQFKEALVSLSSSLAAGRSVENAVLAVPADLKFIYADMDSDMLRELDILRLRLENGEPLELGLQDFADRAMVEEITQFVDVFCIGKRSGGDLIEIIRQTSQMLGEKLEIQQELAVMIARKKFESRIMIAVPFVFLALLGLASPDYMEPLYQGSGYVLLTVSLAVLLGCYWWIFKLTDIKI